MAKANMLIRCYFQIPADYANLFIWWDIQMKFINVNIIMITQCIWLLELLQYSTILFYFGNSII